MLEFDEKVSRMLENAYLGAELTRRRQASFDALAPSRGEVILDIGCGNGLLAAELARAVGPDGRVIGVDPSADMRAGALARCRTFEAVEIHDGSAEALPVADAVADKVVSVQVFEYLPDLDAALQEALRVLKPQGRLVISDLHLGSFVWNSDDPARMDRMRASWDHHFAAGDVPSRLLTLLKASGHVVEDVRPFTMVDHTLKPDGSAQMMMHLMKHFAMSQGHLPEAEAQAWFDEQEALALSGRFFFSLTQYVVIARKVG